MFRRGVSRQEAHQPLDWGSYTTQDLRKYGENLR